MQNQTSARRHPATKRAGMAGFVRMALMIVAVAGTIAGVWRFGGERLSPLPPVFQLVTPGAP